MLSKCNIKKILTTWNTIFRKTYINNSLICWHCASQSYPTLKPQQIRPFSSTIPPKTNSRVVFYAPKHSIATIVTRWKRPLNAKKSWLFEKKISKTSILLKFSGSIMNWPVTNSKLRTISNASESLKKSWTQNLTNSCVKESHNWQEISERALSRKSCHS
jgi:hypothetical protein